MSFGQTVKDNRKRLGLTQAQLATLLDVDTQSVSNWECGRNTPWAGERSRIETILQDRPGRRRRVIDRIDWNG